MRSRRRLLIGILVIVVGLPVLLSALPDLIVNWLWFDSAGFRDVYRTRLFARWGFTLGGFLITFGWLSANLVVASRMTGRYPRVHRINQRIDISWRNQAIVLGWVGVVRRRSV